MRTGIYNLVIPEIIRNSVNRASRPASIFLLQLSLLVLAVGSRGQAADWSVPEQQLAKKIVAVTGPGAAALGFENRSSLGRRDTDIIQNGLRAAMESLGLRFVKAEQSAATVNIALSENASSYVWVAEVRQGSGEPAVVMVSTLRPEGSVANRDAVPLSLRKTPLLARENPILDIAVLEEGTDPTHIAVLDGDNLTLYRMQNGKWELEQAMGIIHNRPWPRDLRGRLIPATDHLLDAYLPGVLCRTSGSPLALSCKDSDDPWPLISGKLSGGSLSVFPSAGLAYGASTVVPQTKAFFASTRNFFTGALTPTLGKISAVPKFYSAALLPREKYTLWLFAAVDGQLHMIDGVSDQAARIGWGSDIASVKTACGAGWQVLASSVGQGEDSIRAYEFPDRDPVAVSAALDFPGPITALWTEARGDTAVVVSRDRQTGSYEAFRLAVACSQ